MWKCKHCLGTFEFDRSQKANHSRWCDQNPKAAGYREDARKMQLDRALLGGVAARTPSAKAKISIKIKQAWADGRCVGTPHTEATKEKLSIKGLESNHRRLLKSCREYTCVDGSKVLLDSSWEEALARRLDEIGVKWERPIDPLKWIDSNGKQRNYFPDFWLPELQLFLDPKNPAAFQAQSEKVAWLTSNRKDVVFLTSLKDCEQFVPRLLERLGPSNP